MNIKELINRSLGAVSISSAISLNRNRCKSTNTPKRILYTRYIDDLQLIEIGSVKKSNSRFIEVNTCGNYFWSTGNISRLYLLIDTLRELNISPVEGCYIYKYDARINKLLEILGWPTRVGNEHKSRKVILSCKPRW